MCIAELDIQRIQAKLEPLLGNRAWGVSLGVGSFITLEFGAVIQDKVPESPRGEWHLWVTYSAWYLEKNGEVLSASEDPRPRLRSAVQAMENRMLRSVEITCPALETVFCFDEALSLHLFPVYSQDYEHWLLYAPDGNVLTVGPGIEWSYSSASEPYVS
jgi:hypothetical protein